MNLKTVSEKFGCLKIANVVLNDERFSIWSGSSNPNTHHYGQGGLLKHTTEVIELCLTNNKVLNCGVDERHLFLAALFHDSGKMWDYECVKGVWQSTRHKHRIHHLPRSAINWCRAIDQTNTFRDAEDIILHAILSHHGKKEFRSPVEPQTKLAWLLHLSDSLSARIDECKE